MNPDGKVIPEKEPEPSQKAQKEAARISAGNLRRDEAVRTHIHRAGLCVFWVFIILMICFSGIWAWHLLMPEKLRYLSERDREAVQTILFTAIASSFATQLIKRWENPKAPSDPDDPNSN